MSNYEADVEAALASIQLERSAEKQRQKYTYMMALADFLRTHPDFKEFYDLVEKVKGY